MPPAYRDHSRTPTGFPRSAPTRCDRGGLPLNPGPDGVLPLRRQSSGVVVRSSAPGPVCRRQLTIDAAQELRDVVKGSFSLARPAFPSPVAVRWPCRSWACASGFTPRRYQRRMRKWGRTLDTGPRWPAHDLLSSHRPSTWVERLRVALAVLLSVRHRSQHAERDRWRSTGPVHPNEESAGQAIRSRTTGEAVKAVPAGATS